MTFIHAPRFVNRDPQPVHFVQGEPECANRTLQNGRVSHVEQITVTEHLPACGSRFFDALWTEINIRPAREAVFFVPDTFSVAQQYKSFHGLPSFNGLGGFFQPRDLFWPLEALKLNAWSHCDSFMPPICIWIVLF